MLAPVFNHLQYNPDLSLHIIIDAPVSPQATALPTERFIRGTLEKETQKTVRALHERFTQKINAVVTQSLPADASDELRKACFDYCIALSRTRQKINAQNVAQKAATGIAALTAATTELLQDLTYLDQSLAQGIPERKHLKIKNAVTQMLHDITINIDDYYLRNAVYSYCHTLVHAGQSVTRAELEADIKVGEQHLRDKTEALFNQSAVPEFMTEENFKKFQAAFGGDPQSLAISFDVANAGPDAAFPAIQERTYFKLLDESASPVRPLIEEYLKNKVLGKNTGFTITDYAEGYAVDTKNNQWRIGKLLKDAPGLLKSYQDDPYRISKDLMVVITRSYEDLARASYGRGWKSCRADAGSAVRNAIAEIDVGVMAAYLVSVDDPDLHDPLGRVNIKPYVRTNADNTVSTAYFTFNPIGLHHPGFVDAVNQYVSEHLNKGLTGSFQLRQDCESYREFGIRTLLPDDVEEALKQMGAPYTKDENGQITVNGDINLRDQGLYKLPDLTKVIVNGSVDVSKNKLLTLHGLPQKGVKSLNVSNNLLSCFVGCPARITGTFNYQSNPYLLTTLGVPEATRYKYGNDGYHPTGEKDKWGDAVQQHNYSEGVTPVSPQEQPIRFPGFKKNK